MNREYASYVITELIKWGAAEFYICAGARNIPLIEAILNIKTQTSVSFHHFEERSASFYALGRIKSLNKPVVVLTTSGTAVGELLSATMEAYYSGLPLVLLTADRPRSYRGSGAPQSALQKNIFGPYVSNCIDVEANEKFDLSDVIKNRPLHINVCLAAPLQSGELLPVYKDEIKQYEIKNAFEKYQSDKEKLNLFLNQNKKLLVIVSQIVQKDKSNIIEFLKKLNVPVYIEGISNMRECEELEYLRIRCADKIWENEKESGYNITAVLKIGSTPTHRIWRDLMETRRNIEVFSISENDFSGMPGIEYICTDINLFFSRYNGEPRSSPALKKFKDLDSLSYEKLFSLFKKYPNAEQSLYFYLSQYVQKNAKIYLGNSLPVRYWDLAATFEDRHFTMDASRGLSGIDGQISTFLGFSEESSEENWGIFGDLTALYDLAAPWILAQRKNLNVNICIVNNGGGKIFSKIISGESAKICQNIHSLNFSNWAQMWNMDYERVDNFISRFCVVKNDRIHHTKPEGAKIIELIPDEEQTELFAKEI